jgi:hypothetical protein
MTTEKTPYNAKHVEDEIRMRPTAESPWRYLRSPAGTLHIRRPGPEDDGLSNHYARCGWYTDLGAEAIPLKVSADARVCKRCAVIEP